jgi:putative phage-type endonuclease
MQYEHERHGPIVVTPHVHEIILKDLAESCPQRTAPWYKKRNDHLTASAMATACGGNPYETKMTLLKKKTGNGVPFKGNHMTEHGNKYEHVALEKYEAVTGEKVVEFGLLESMNPGEKFLAGSPDGITASGRLIEIKCPFKRVPTDSVPEHYKYQLQFLMQILNLPVCDFIQLVPETHWTSEIFIITVVKRDPYWWKEKLPMITRFWEEVLEVREAQARGEQPLAPKKKTPAEEEGGEPLFKEGKTLTIVTAKKCEIDIGQEKEREEIKVIELDEEEKAWSQVANFFT